MYLAKTYFEHNLIHRDTWRRAGRESEQNALIDYVITDERIGKERNQNDHNARGWAKDVSLMVSGDLTVGEDNKGTNV